MCLCFFGFLRAGEMTIPSDSAFDAGAHLMYREVAVDNVANPSTLRVRIKASYFVKGSISSWGELMLSSALSRP